MAQEIFEAAVAIALTSRGEELGEARLEPQLAFRRERQGERRHPWLGERGRVEAGALTEARAPDAVAGGMAEEALPRRGHERLDRAHRAAEAGEAVEEGGERPVLL